jgi:hypothetical protein
MKIRITESQYNILVNKPWHTVFGNINEGGKPKITQDEFIKRAQETHQNPDGTPKYNYDKVIYVDKETPVTVTCPKHNHDFNPRPADHLYKRSGCPKCAGKLKTTEEFVQQAQEIYKNPDGTPKYNYDDVNYINDKTDVIIYCPIHGMFKKNRNEHIIKKQGCPDCGIMLKGRKKDTQDEFINKAKKIHGDKFTYDNVNYLGSKENVYITCPKHGDFPRTPNDLLQGKGCPICRESKGEKIIRDYLENELRIPKDKINPENTFDDCNNEHKGNIRCYKYKFDFYLPTLNAIIEFDGIQHFQRVPFFHKTDEDFNERVMDDLHKVNYCKNKFKLIRISYNENDIIGQLKKGLSNKKQLWLSDNYPKAGWNK